MGYKSRRKKLFFQGKTFNPDREKVTKAVGEYLKGGGRITRINKDDITGRSFDDLPPADFVGGVYAD